MATVYKTPGVYVEEVSTFPPSVAQVETAIPAFIGYTEKAADENGDKLLLRPKRITSMLEYERFFGGAQSEKVTVTITDTTKTEGGSERLISRDITAGSGGKQSNHIMYYSVQLFYANGGGPCYIVSVGEYKEHGDNIPGGALSSLAKGINALETADEPTLLLLPETVNIEDAGDSYDLYDLALAQCDKLQDRFTIIDLHGNSEETLRNATQGIGMNFLKYGAAYHPWLKTSLPVFAEDNQVSIDHSVSKDGGNPGAGKWDKKTLVDVGDDGSGDFPLYNQVIDRISKMRVTLPPGPAIAGVYAMVDRSRGVWKAPANVSLGAVNGLTKEISHEMQENLNIDVNAGKSVNAIRAFPGRGILVWGDRTLAGNDNEWRYVSVRRFFNMVEESCKKATAQFVFEPNDANTWTKVRAMIENFLTVLWRQGALAGAKPEHAFFVKCGLGQTMTALDILEGRMIVEIGMAAVRPAEFIILRFSHKMQES